jgi:hypothetical protein
MVRTKNLKFTNCSIIHGSFNIYSTNGMKQTDIQEYDFDISLIHTCRQRQT